MVKSVRTPYVVVYLFSNTLFKYIYAYADDMENHTYFWENDLPYSDTRHFLFLAIHSFLGFSAKEKYMQRKALPSVRMGVVKTEYLKTKKNKQ